MPFVNQRHLSELQEHLGRSIKSSLCVPVVACAGTESEVIAVACLINKRSILSRSVLRTDAFCLMLDLCPYKTSVMSP